MKNYSEIGGIVTQKMARGEKMKKKKVFSIPLMLVYFPTLTTIKSCSESCRISLLDFTGKDNKCNCGVLKQKKWGHRVLFFIVLFADQI